VCNVFDRHPCQPGFLPPIGQDLHLTVKAAARSGEPAEPLGGNVDTIADLFAQLRRCWQPPPLADAFPGMEMTIRLAFTRAGDILGEPRFTFASKLADGSAKARYQRTLVDAFNRCTPIRFTEGMGGAVAGRPLTFHIVDDRQIKKTENQTEKAK
jgi:hypothetical protein